MGHPPVGRGGVGVPPGLLPSLFGWVGARALVSRRGSQDVLLDPAGHPSSRGAMSTHTPFRKSMLSDEESVV